MSDKLYQKFWVEAQRWQATPQKTIKQDISVNNQPATFLLKVYGGHPQGKKQMRTNESNRLKNQNWPNHNVLGNVHASVNIVDYINFLTEIRCENIFTTKRTLNIRNWRNMNKSDKLREKTPPLTYHGQLFSYLMTREIWEGAFGQTDKNTWRNLHKSSSSSSSSAA